MMFGSGFNLLNSCFGYGAGFMNYGMILLTAIVIMIIAFFVSKRNKRNSDNYALETLKIRLAKGEITEDEYFRRKNILD
jgi:putative membrane protein